MNQKVEKETLLKLRLGEVMLGRVATGEMQTRDTLPYQVNFLEVRVSRVQPCKTPKGSLTEPHLSFLKAEALAFLLSKFTTESLIDIARPVFSFSVAFSDPSWLHLLLAFLPGPVF